MIGIVNYGSGNIQAISNIYGRLGIPHMVAAHPEQLLEVDRIVLPGVGAFDQAMLELERSGMRHALDAAITDKKPILGICVGMQLLAKSSEEGKLPGLGWIDATVKRFDREAIGMRAQLPHMGWNTVNPVSEGGLFAGVDLSTGYYFLHSYFFAPRATDDILAHTTYGTQFSSAVRHGNIYGVQFHPEKSHGAGIQLLKNFSELA